MKFRSILFALLLGSIAISQAQTFNPERKYKEGQADAYSMKINMSSSMGELGLSMKMKNTVKKVYENGDADIETAITDMVMNMAGNEMKPPAGKPTSVKMNKFGVPVNAPKSGGMNFGQITSFIGDKEMTVGQSYPFEIAEKENPNNKMKGVAKLVSVEGGVATVFVTAEKWTDKIDKPMKFEGTSTIDTATTTLIKFEGKATDMPSMGAGAPTITSATFLMERIKA